MSEQIDVPPDREPGEEATVRDEPLRGERVTVEFAEGVAVVRLDRPPMNAIDSITQRELLTAAQWCSSTDAVAAVVLTGGEQVFAAGADIKEMVRLGHAEMVAASRLLTDSLSAVARIGKPVVAAVNGYALGGGCELALCADLRIAGASAKLGQPEVKLGVIPGGGGTQRLTRLIGPSRAKDLILTGRIIDAEEALRIGLVDQVVPDAEVTTTALAWARQFVGGARLALQAAKEAIDAGAGVDLATGLEIERHLFAAMFATADRAEGMTAFVERRSPEFRGH